MPTLLFRFPGRRYHATPWGHHVNEGLIEWPPSPWRLLRALLATGYASLGWPADGPPGQARELIEKLATVLPLYRLPAAAGAHSRHYMPMARFKNGVEEKTLVFDTWAQVGDGELAVTWDVQLTQAETTLLADLADRMGYLGRSESWVSARIATLHEALPAGTDCLPCEGVARPGPGWEQIPLLAAQPAPVYAAWRSEQLAVKLADLPAPTAGKRTSWKIAQARAKVEVPYPPDLIACLQYTTDDLRKHGWSQPPGSRRVFYWRAPDALESRTLPQAERLHAQLVAVLKGNHNPALTGCDEARRPLRQPHVHAHILPLDLDGDGHLEHILIWAPMGLDAEAQSAVRAVRSTYTKGGVGPLRLALVGSGSLRDLAEQLSSRPGGRVLLSLLGHPQGATVWRSLTPFVPPRHLKPRGRHTLHGQVVAELASRGLPAPSAVLGIDPRASEQALRMRHFIRNRRLGPSAPIDCGFALELRFEREVQGPISLGYGSHYGLGLFAAQVG